VRCPLRQKAKKPIETPPSSNTRSGCWAQQKGGEAPIDASSSTLKVRKNAQKKKGKRLKTMLAVQKEADEGQFLLSPPTASRKTAAPSPMVVAATGTLIYLNSYGDTEAPAEALASDEEVDYMPDCIIVLDLLKEVKAQSRRRPNNPKEVKAQRRRSADC
jgi:hypothetical protein